MDNKTNIKNLAIADQIEGTDLVLVSVNGKARRALASLLKGQKGDNLELQITDTHIQWRLVGGEWQNLISYDELRGPLQDAANECISATNDLRELETNVSENEQARMTSETSRNNEEEGRKTSENERVQAEKERIAAEILRIKTENERVDSENYRVTAENNRVSEFSDLRNDIKKATEDANNATEGANNATAELREVETSCLTATDNANKATRNANDAAKEARDFINDANRVIVTESDKINWNDKYTRDETDAEITKHNESDTAHSDIRNSLTNIINGNSIVKKAEYTQKLGSEEDSYTKSTLDAKINKHIKSVDYNPTNAVFTFTFEDGTTKLIDTPIENTVKDGRLDSVTNEVVLVLVSGQEIRIPAYKLIKVYSGQTTATTTTSVSAEGKISVDLKQGVVDTVHLSQTLQNAIASHQTKTGDTANNVSSFSEQTTRTNLSSGDKHSVLFGKIKKWFADLKAVAFSGKASDLTDDSTHRFVTDSEKSNWNGKAAGSHTHTRSQISDFPSSMPASDVYSWAKQSSKPTYNASEVGAAPSIHEHNVVIGNYTGNGGQQPPSYIPGGRTRFNMMNTPINGDGSYKDFILMDNYAGGDVPVVTAFGISKSAALRAFIMQGVKGGAAWNRTAELYTTANFNPANYAAVGHNHDGTYQPKGNYALISDIPSFTKTDIIGKLNQSGEVVVTQHWKFNGGLANYSDIRYKKNIIPIGSVIEKLKNISVFKYNWEFENGELAKRRIGVSAQEMGEIFKELVDVSDDDRKTKSVDIPGQIALLFAAVKELAHENLMLKQKLGI